MYEDNTHPHRVTAQRAVLKPPPWLPEPPPDMTDPVICYGFVSRPQWSRLIRGAIPNPAIVGLARTVADYGSPKGQHCHPGIARLAGDVGCSTRTVMRHLAWLTEYGFLHLAKRGSYRRGRQADHYWLAVPAPIAAAHTAHVLCNLNRPWWVERPVGDGTERCL